MNVNDIASLITTVGFPIVCCGVCFWYLVKTSEQHKEEMDKMSEAINNNTLVMQKLIDKLGAEE